jgi:hypothetical protein
MFIWATHFGEQATKSRFRSNNVRIILVEKNHDRFDHLSRLRLRCFVNTIRWEIQGKSTIFVYILESFAFSLADMGWQRRVRILGIFIITVDRQKRVQMQLMLPLVNQICTAIW